MKSNFERRVRFLYVILFLVALLCVGRLYFLQIVYGDTYREKANSEIFNGSPPIFSRGTIYYSGKNNELASAATLMSGHILSINPSLLPEANEVYEKLSAIVPLDKDIFLKKASRLGDPYEELARRLGENETKKIADLKIKGVGLYKEQWRVYPSDNLASHIIGFVGYNGDSIEGRYGLERYYDDNLKKEDRGSEKNFFVEIFSNAEKFKKGGGELEADIVTTIDPASERMLEEELEKVSEEFGSKISGGIIMNPVTGEIIAAAVNPDFNPNKYGEEKNVSVFSNSLVEGVYEMGSIVKPLTVAAGIDSHLFTASTTYRDEGFLKVGNRTIYNFDKVGRGVVSMQEVLSQSLNTGVATIALKMGKKKFEHYIREFGLGDETGVDLPSEAAGLLKNLEKGGDVELANASFGQGIAVTPIAMTRALSALGNGGFLPNPHVVKEIKYDLGFSKKIVVTPEEMKRVISKETSEEITRMLVEVVDKALKGGTVKMEHYSVAAKTGTAQIANKEGGGYYPDRYLHSFFGYFPAYDPKFIIFLYTVEPNADYASNTLTIPFINIVKFLINYYEIPPDR